MRSGCWPAFWLNPGVEYPDGHFSALPWPPEIDIFEFFVWQHRTRPKIMECNVRVNGTQLILESTLQRIFTCSHSTGARICPVGIWMGGK